MQARILSHKAVILLVLAVLPTVAGATVDTQVQLTDRNSNLIIELGPGSGMKDWLVEGVDQLNLQWFWYRIGPSGPEHPIDELGMEGYKLADNDWDAGDEHLVVLYGDPGSSPLTVELALTLAGANPGSYRSDIGEVITLTNNGTSAMELHFFQYCDLDLDGTPYDTLAQIVGGNTAQQAGETLWTSETVVTPMPSHREVSVHPVLLNLLDPNDPNPTTLSDVTGPVTNDNLVWAFQWDFVIGPDQSVHISKNKAIIPEPGSLALLAMGALLFIPRVRRATRPT